MKIKKIISSLLAMSMTMSMACTTAFADYDTYIIGQYGCKQINTSILQNNGITTLALDEYEPNDFDNPKSIGGINSFSNPLITVNAGLSVTDGDTMDGYSFYTSKYNGFEVEEVFVQIIGLEPGDVFNLLITGDDKAYVAETVYGDLGNGIGYLLPTCNKYNIYISLMNGSNSEINYTLQVASRYVHDTQQFYARPTTIKYSSNSNFSSPGYITISESNMPSSAIVDAIFINGTITNTRTGKSGGTCTVRLKNGSEEIAGPCPSKMNDLTHYNIPLVGTWEIAYHPDLYAFDNHTLSNFSATFDFTYDILVG